MNPQYCMDNIIIDQTQSKYSIVKSLLCDFSPDYLLKYFIELYENNHNPYYLSLVYFLPNSWLKKMVDEDNYFLRLIKYKYYFQSEPISSLNFFKDDINDEVQKNILLLSNRWLNKQPLIIDGLVIDLGNKDEPSLMDLIESDIIYDYQLLENNQDAIISYFYQWLLYKSELLIRDKIIETEWTFVRTINQDTWGSIMEEFKTTYSEEDTPKLKHPYQFKDSLITFLSLENKKVEFVYKKTLPIPDNVIDNPLKLRSHLLSLSKWYFSKRFKSVTFHFPYSNLTIQSNKLNVHINKIIKLLPYVNKNVLISILKFSKKISVLRSMYPLEYVKLNLNNLLNYEALRSLDIDVFGQFQSELFELQKETEQNENYQIFSTEFLNNKFTYDCYSKYYYQLSNRIDRYLDYYLLTNKAINISFSKGFHYATQISLICNHIYSTYGHDYYKNYRSLISEWIKSDKSIDELKMLIENSIDEFDSTYENESELMFDGELLF